MFLKAGSGGPVKEGSILRCVTRGPYLLLHGGKGSSIEACPVAGPAGKLHALQLSLPACLVAREGLHEGIHILLLLRQLCLVDLPWCSSTAGIQMLSLQHHVVITDRQAGHLCSRPARSAIMVCCTMHEHVVAAASGLTTDRQAGR